MKSDIKNDYVTEMENYSGIGLISIKTIASWKVIQVNFNENKRKLSKKNRIK